MAVQPLSQRVRLPMHAPPPVLRPTRPLRTPPQVRNLSFFVDVTPGDRVLSLLPPW
jgi:hypothetical protein